MVHRKKNKIQMLTLISQIEKGAKTEKKDEQRKFEIKYVGDFLGKVLADKLFNMLVLTPGWKGEQGKRITLSLGEKGTSYTYNRESHIAQVWDDEMQLLGTQIMVTEESLADFNFALCNWYEDGKVGLGFHADNEPDIEENSIIASISLGTPRTFVMKEKWAADNEIMYRKELEHGSLLIMKGTAQKHLKHAILKTQSSVGPRINITFRTIKKKEKTKQEEEEEKRKRKQDDEEKKRKEKEEEEKKKKEQEKEKEKNEATKPALGSVPTKQAKTNETQEEEEMNKKEKDKQNEKEKIETTEPALGSVPTEQAKTDETRKDEENEVETEAGTAAEAEAEAEAQLLAELETLVQTEAEAQLIAQAEAEAEVERIAREEVNDSTPELDSVPTTETLDRNEALDMLTQLQPTAEVFKRMRTRIGNDKDKSLNFEMIKRWRTVMLEILDKAGITRWAGVVLESKDQWYGYMMMMIWNDEHDMEQTIKFRNAMLKKMENIISRDDRIRIREEKYETKEVGLLAKLLQVKMRIGKDATKPVLITKKTKTKEPKTSVIKPITTITKQTNNTQEKLTRLQLEQIKMSLFKGEMEKKVNKETEKLMSEKEKRRMKLKDNTQTLWTARKIIEGKWEMKGITLELIEEDNTPEENIIKFEGEKDKERLETWRHIIYALVNKEGTMPILYEMMRQDNKWTRNLLEQAWELYPNEANTIAFRKWFVSLIGLGIGERNEAAVMSKHFRGDKVSIEVYIERTTKRWKYQQEQKDKDEERRKSPRFKQTETDKPKDKDEERRRSPRFKQSEIDKQKNQEEERQKKSTKTQTSRNRETEKSGRRKTKITKTQTNRNRQTENN